ncbi:MAG TPA: FAD-dependent oxidoreductase [Bacillota bacterium]|nr:FAD-dependent oxidoreductase [Bacillota bacterium]
MPKYVIVGAGILGATTAYQLARNGADVIVVDRSDSGQATNAAAGIVSPWLSKRRNKAWYKLAKNGANIYPDIVADLARDGEENTGYAQVGAMYLHHIPEKLAEMEKRALERRNDAPEMGEVTRLNPEETKRKFPILADNYGAVYISGAARVNGRQMKRALLNGAKKHGASMIIGHAELLHESSRITGIKVNGNTIEADMVIACTGAWMHELLRPLKITFDVVPQKGQIMHVQLKHQNTHLWPVVKPPGAHYLLSFDDRIILGASREDGAGFDQNVTAGGINDILTEALKIAPDLRQSTILETRVGFRPFTPNSHPIIGPLPGYDGLLLANGLGATGITIGPYMGNELAKLALGNTLDIDLADYDVAHALR